jgi:hypothetical protein
VIERHIKPAANVFPNPRLLLSLLLMQSGTEIIVKVLLKLGQI